MKSKKTFKTLKTIVILILILVITIVATICICNNESISSGVSLYCSLLSIVLSIIALWYTIKSGTSMDNQFLELKSLIQEMRYVQHELDVSINKLEKTESELPPELKDKITDFKENLKSDEFSFL